MGGGSNAFAFLGGSPKNSSKPNFSETYVEILVIFMGDWGLTLAKTVQLSSPKEKYLDVSEVGWSDGE